MESTTSITLQRKRIIYVRPFIGEIEDGDLQLITDDLNTSLAENEILCEAVFIGIDAGLKTQVLYYPDGITMIGCQIAKVIDSKNDRFPIGCHIYGKFGWQTHTITNPNEVPCSLTPYVLPDFGEHSLSLGLGCLGLTGNAAIYGMSKICCPKPKETFVISAAAGGVGNLVGQLAKLNTCRTIGITSTDKKCKWLKKEVGFDFALNYNAETFPSDLKTATPDGVDCFFDSVGGTIADHVIRRMNEKGRIAVCGSMATTNSDALKPSKSRVDTNELFVSKQLILQGFTVWDLKPKEWMDNIQSILDKLNHKQIRNFETVLEGLDKAPAALKQLISGKFNGRVVIKIK